MWTVSTEQNLIRIALKGRVIAFPVGIMQHNHPFWFDKTKRFLNAVVARTTIHQDKIIWRKIARGIQCSQQDRHKLHLAFHRSRAIDSPVCGEC